ncbi:MAG: DUF6371 domain-containing protein [Algoriphagus aquaeductus]|uniref:DUF6371 domain-containing protein n=1 Tax=Algoriphagus aquaeductus TaxID=475299 RepID=UPI00391BEEA2
MENHRYHFDKSSKKFRCPACQKKTFVLYVDTLTGNYLPEQYGKCDRESNCGFSQLPPPESKCLYVPFESISEKSEKAFQIKQDSITYYLPKATVFEIQPAGAYVTEYFLQSAANAPTFFQSDCKYFTPEGKATAVQATPKKLEKPEQVFIPTKVFEQTLQPERYELNLFIQNLLSRVSYPVKASDLEKVISMYYLGTIAKGEMKGAVSFPFIDRFGNVRAVQVKQFDETNHTVSTSWLHSIIARDASTKPDWLEAYQRQESKVSCLFGEHLFTLYPNNPIALVEAPKTAIYGALYFGLPKSQTDWIWLAVYNLTSLNLEKCRVLEGRKVFLFPDLSKDGKAFSLWSSKALEMEAELKGTRFFVSDLLERVATEAERLAGLDLADYLIQQDWRKFRNPTSEENENERIEQLEKAIDNSRSRIDELRKSIKGMESTFIQVAKDLPIQWFDKSFSGKIQPANRLSLIKYWCE